MWKKSFLDNKSLFDISLRNLDDWDFNLRMIYEEPRMNFISKPLINYTYSEDSLALEIKKLNLTELNSEIKAREKHINLLYGLNLINEKNALQKYLNIRLIWMLRELSLQRNISEIIISIYPSFLKNMLLNFKFITFCKVSIGVIGLTFFKRGYSLFKVN